MRKGKSGKRSIVAFDQTLAAAADNDAADDVPMADGDGNAGDGADAMDDEDSGMDVDDGDDDGDDEIEADWEFYPFHAADWHSVKQHCARLLDGRQWDAGSLATIITEQQPEVGSAIKLGERSTEAIGIGAIISIQQFAQAPCVRSAVDFALSHFAGDDLDRMRAVLGPGSNARVGWFINERLLNAPPLLALPLHASLFEEMQRVNEAHRQRKASGRAPYDFDYLLFITVAYNDARVAPHAAMGKKKARENVTQYEWFHPEEAIYMEHAVCSAVWPIHVQDQASRWTFEGAIAQFKVVMLVPVAAVPKILTRFDEINATDFDEDGNPY